MPNLTQAQKENVKQPKWTDAQKTAIQLRDQLILVSAAAGSGKTAVLTERVIRRILDAKSGVKLTDLLIVTFTRSAAAELKSKIAKAIENEIAKEDLESAAKDKLRDQLLQLGNAQISTIDSFYLQIVRDHFDQLGLPANFRLADENELRVLSEEILDDLIPEYYNKYEIQNASSEENPFTKIRNNLFADCVDHIFDGTSSSNLNDIFLRFYESFARVKGGINALSESANLLRAESKLPFLQTHFGKIFLSRFKPFLLSYCRILEEVKAHHQTDPKAEQKQGGILADDRFHCESALEAIREKDWERLQGALSAFVFQRFQSVSGKPEWSERYHNARNAFSKEIQKYTVLANAITPVEQENTFLKTAEFADLLYRFYSDFQKRYRAEKIKRGVQDFNDVRDALYQLLKDPKNESLVQSIRDTYKEVYIDEYQDVDEIQDEIFAKIGGRNRFMVGDIKQSIYGFRGSDPSVFANYRNTMPLAPSPESKKADSVCVFMSDNFRCDRPIVDLTNAVCPFLFSASPESIHYLPEDDLKCSKPPLEDRIFEPAPISIRIFEKPPQKNDKNNTEKTEESEKAGIAELHWVAEEIGRLLREGKNDNGSNIKPSDIAILSRKKDSLAQFQKELETNGIPVVNISGNPVSRSPLFVDLFNLLRIVDNPYRDLPLSEYLLSDFGGFTLEDIRMLRADFSIEKSLYDAMISAAESDHPLFKKTSAFVGWLERYRGIAAVQSADRFLRILYEDQLFRPYAFSPEFLTIYEQARSYQQSSWSGLYGFLNQLDRLVQADKLESGFRKTENAVNAMTIHASKGLEFPVVFLVDCGRSMQTDSHKPRLIYRKEIGFASNLYGEETELSCPSFLKTIADSAVKDAEIEEEVRLFYVAVTRAREKLYITATPTRKMESFIAEASLIRKNDRYSILSAKSYIDWIYGALYRSSAALGNFDLQTVPFSLSAPEDAPSAPEEMPVEKDYQNPVFKTPFQSAQQDNPTAEHYQTILERSKTFVYPLDALQGIPTKAAASKLQKNLLDVLKGEDEQKAIAERLKLMNDGQLSFQGLLDARKKPTAAEIGSATHAFLALCNFENLSAAGAEEELKRLHEQKFISEETAKIVNLHAIKRFAESELIKKIQTAKEVYREQQFSLFVPLEELTQNRELANALAGQELFVQGSIDLLLVGEDGRIELYDYKTDHITDEEQNNPALLKKHLQDRHGNQLEIYARAVEKLFGKCPDRISIFSLSIGKIIELF
ncbi:MAG: hypothetical protein E7680_07215 [Ruminococcaceae bacterium]|nr:hypothetical protein [Oscillospiraceae bacterium]